MIIVETILPQNNDVFPDIKPGILGAGGESFWGKRTLPDGCCGGESWPLQTSDW